MLVVFEAMSRRCGAVVDDDVLFKFRLRLFGLAAELGDHPWRRIEPGSKLYERVHKEGLSGSRTK